MKKSLILIIIITIFVLPVKTSAAIQFGGSIQRIIGCVNDGLIYTLLGPPRGGEYIWSPTVTDTYAFGPPKRTGQWLLGNAAVSHFCIASVIPWDVKPGWLMMSVGSSQ